MCVCVYTFSFLSYLTLRCPISRERPICVELRPQAKTAVPMQYRLIIGIFNICRIDVSTSSSAPTKMYRYYTVCSFYESRNFMKLILKSFVPSLLLTFFCEMSQNVARHEHIQTLHLPGYFLNQNY